MDKPEINDIQELELVVSWREAIHQTLLVLDSEQSSLNFSGRERHRIIIQKCNDSRLLCS